MQWHKFGCVGLACLFMTAGAAAPAVADGWRFPSLTYASDAELGSITRTGFIISPDWSFNDEVSLGGTGGALLEDPDGFAIGAKLGYDQQFGSLVLGVITDGFYSFADGKGPGIYNSELNYYGTVRGRLGVGLGRFMPYATAGYAYGGLEITNTATGASDSKTLSGWVYGGGLEYVWNNDLTLHAGYRRIDFDDQTFSVLPGTLSPELDVFDFGLVTRY
jgi:outer membrane immunogenic protein